VSYNKDNTQELEGFVLIPWEVIFDVIESLEDKDHEFLDPLPYGYGEDHET